MQHMGYYTILYILYIQFYYAQLQMLPFQSFQSNYMFGFLLDFISVMYGLSRINAKSLMYQNT